MYVCMCVCMYDNTQEYIYIYTYTNRESSKKYIRKLKIMVRPGDGWSLPAQPTLPCRKNMKATIQQQQLCTATALDKKIAQGKQEKASFPACKRLPRWRRRRTPFLM